MLMKMEIFDDCLAPARFVFLTYNGKNPFGVCQKVSGMLQSFFDVSSSGTAETDFRWDNTGPDDEFYHRWWVQKKFSGRTKMWVYIVVQGAKNRETNEGWFTMKINAQNETKVSSKNPMIRMLWWTYAYFFYNRRRSEYLRRCNELVYDFRDDIKEHFNLQQQKAEG